VTVLGGEGRSPRGLRDVGEIVDGAGMSPRARDRAVKAFELLAAAEAAVHGVDPERVHFHEVGADDALADVCGVAAALEDLEVDRVVCSPLPVARGLVEASHGTLPLPAPATLELLRGAPLEGVDPGHELVTPTGAALIAALASGYGELPRMRLEATGYGAGSRELGSRPNVVRALLGEPLRDAYPPAPAAEVALVETNLDDLLPELVPDAVEEVSAAGALDTWVTSVQMKKGRPGVVISAIARPADEAAVAEAMVRHTSTLGVRVSRALRWELEREWRTVEVGDEPVRVKVGRLAGSAMGAAPEHDDCVEVARRTGRPVRAVWAAALAAAERSLDGAGRAQVPAADEPDRSRQ
jgi:pyridinium-3,5-bisthiocarboxylic acid mononucleotide nickel chelatase